MDLVPVATPVPLPPVCGYIAGGLTLLATTTWRAELSRVGFCLGFSEPKNFPEAFGSILTVELRADSFRGAHFVGEVPLSSD
jgi:hypothetical protein